MEQRGEQSISLSISRIAEIGVDGMKYTDLKGHLAKNGEIIKEQLGTRKYKPQPVAEWRYQNQMAVSET